MQYNLKKIFIFVTGVVLGSAVTWKFAKCKYEEIANEEIASVKERYSKGIHDLRETIEEPIEPEDKDNEPDKKEYESIISEQGYDKDYVEEPYMISPDEFSEFDDYEAIDLTYYEGDGVLADEDDELVDDVIETVGKNVLEYLQNENSESVVHVRNDKLKSDYEICKVSGSYEDVAQNY